MCLILNHAEIFYYDLKQKLSKIKDWETRMNSISYLSILFVNLSNSVSNNGQNLCLSHVKHIASNQYLQGIHFYCCYLYSVIYFQLSARETENKRRQRETIHPNARNSQCWAGLEPGPRNCIRAPTVGEEGPGNGTVTCYLLERRMVGNRMGSRGGTSAQVTKVRCHFWDHKSCLSKAFLIGATHMVFS